MFLAGGGAALAACLEIFNLQREQSQKRFLNNLAIPLRLLPVPSRVPLTQRETPPDWWGYFCAAAGRVGEKNSACWREQSGSQLLTQPGLQGLPCHISYFHAALCRKQEYLTGGKQKICNRYKIIIKQKKAPTPEEQLGAEWKRLQAGLWAFLVFLHSRHWLFHCLQGWNRAGKLRVEYWNLPLKVPFSDGKRKFRQSSRRTPLPPSKFD